MKNKATFTVSLFIMIISIICMIINRFIFPLPDNVIRITGVIILINLVLFSYSAVKLKNSCN